MGLFNQFAAGSNRVIASVDAIRELLEQNDERIFDYELSKAYVGMESESSLDNRTRDCLISSHNEIKNLLGSSNNWNGSDEALDAAAQAAIILGDHKSISDFAKNAGLEAFSDCELGKYRAETIAATAMMADQRSILNKLYPVISVGGKYNGVSIELPRFVKLNNTVNPMTGERMDFQRYHLTRAYRDLGALKANFNKLYPIVITSTNEALFIPASVRPYENIPELPGLKTAPIAPFTKEINLLGLSRIPGTTEASRHTYNDRIEEGGKVSTIFVSIGTGDDQVLLPITTNNINAAEFIRGANIEEKNDVHSLINTKSLTQSLKSAAIGTNPNLVALRDAGYTRVTFGIILDHRLNLHNGNITQLVSAVEVTGLYKDGDIENYLTHASVTSDINALVPTFAGVNFDLAISSKTIRLQGIRVDDHRLPYMFHCRAQSPITADRAIKESDTQRMMEIMTAAAVIERDNATLRHFLTTVGENLELYEGVSTPVEPQGQNKCGLIYMDRPYVRQESYSINEITDIQQSSEKLINIQAAITHILADVALDMITETSVRHNKRLYMKDSNARVNFALVTSPQIGRYIYTEGDERTFGAIKEVPEIIPVEAPEFTDKIIMVMISDKGSSQNVDPFGWGNCIEGVPLVYDVEINAEGGLKRHLQLQPFYDFTNNNPNLFVLEIKGIGEYLRSKQVFRTEEVA